MELNQENFSERIRQYKVFLINTLREEADFILQLVHQDKLVTDREYLNLKDGQREKIVINLLDKLRDKGEESCRKFTELLRQEIILETFPKLKNHPIIAATDTPVQDPVQKDTCIQHLHTDRRHKDTPFILEEYYAMTQRPSGYCLIINNKNFQTMNNRKGTDKDKDDLTRVFHKMHYLVEVQNDLQGPEILSVINTFAQKDHSRMDAFVCCILSNGAAGTVFGIDGKQVLIRDLMSPFAKCHTLENKPKIFFIQACQYGSQQDVCMAYGSSDSHCNIPTDFLIGMSTAENYQSFRHTTEGSIYIQELCRQLENLCPRKEDILSILIKVNREVSKNNFRGYKQIPEPRYTLTKKLVLPMD